jgi:glycosyltransferase involved in cell wall biosynthesis
MFNSHTVHVVIPAYNEEDTIAEVVAEFLTEDHVDHVIVVDNNCADQTGQLARRAGAEVIQESEAGYGCAIRAGLDHATAAHAEILVIVEADGSFRASDLPKLLHYLSDCRMVLGTRTTRQMVQQGANMNKLLRWGNVTMAKLLELCWYLPHEPRLTDVGCTYRALWADAWLTIKPGTTEAGPSFSPEMICEAYRRGLRVIEIPVAYGERLGGESSHSDSFRKVAGTATGMFKTIMRKRFLG